MDFIKDAFARMDLRQIRQFPLYGVDDLDCETQPYRERLQMGSDPIYNRFKSLCPDESDLDKAAADLSIALTAYEGVYMEMGMKAGTRLVYQLLVEDDRPHAETSE